MNKSVYRSRNVVWGPFNSIKTWRIAMTFVFIAALLFAGLAALRITSASNPTGATINSTANAPITWTGTATGGGALNAPLGLIAPEDL